ncbi:MAG: nucleotidyltransferase family protein [Anaerolineales bacterium]|nr:MAG: nucleotidyltransferase family protein [Anaerolineales bacterium]
MKSVSLLTKQEVLAQIEDNHDQLRALGVRRLGLFGSFARNDPTAESDVDVLVEFEPDQKTFDNFMRLVFLLEDVLQRPVEVVTAESLSPYLRPYIMNEVEYVPLSV